MICLLTALPEYADSACSDRTAKEDSKIMSSNYLDALLKLPGLSACEVSPDGKRVAWSWFRTGPNADVFLAPTDGSTPPVRLTQSKQDTMLVAWTMDSKSIIVSQDHDGDEREQLFRIDIDRTPAMIPITKPHPDFFLRGGDLHPNRRWLIYGANYDFQSGKEQEETWVYRDDLETGEKKVLAKPKKAGYVVPDLNPQGTMILYNRNDLDPSGEQIWLVDIDGKSDREILNFGDKVKVHAGWFPDGKRVIFLAENHTYHRVGVYDTEQNTTSWLIDDPRRNIEGAYVPFGSEDVVIVEIDRARIKSSLVSVATKRETPFPAVKGNLTPYAPIGNGKWIGIYYSSKQPADLVSFPFDHWQDDQVKSVTRIWERTSLKAEDLTPAEEYSWQSVDALTVHGWLYRAKNPVGTIVVIHGGPTAHSEDSLDIEIQYYVQRGFNVLDPNYRGSTGYGMEFRESIKKDGWGGKEQQDILTGIKSLIAAGIATPGKVGVTGTSYGGYSSWWAITHFSPDMVAAAAPICGMTDLVVDYETTRPDLRPYSEEMMGGSPAQVPERYKDRSPINFVSGIKGKLLIVQGLKDPNVTPKNVSDVKAALDGKNIGYSVLAFKDEGHGIGKPKNQRKLYSRIAEFFASSFADHSDGPGHSAGN